MINLFLNPAPKNYTERPTINYHNRERKFLKATSGARVTSFYIAKREWDLNPVSGSLCRHVYIFFPGAHRRIRSSRHG